MATRPPSAFERAFPRRELFRGRARWALLAWTFGSLSLVLLLVNLALITSVLVDRGVLDVPRDRVGDVIELIGPSAADAVRPMELSRDLSRYADAGLLPAVWRSRERFWGPPLAAVYRGVPPLRDTRAALAVLILCAVAVGFLRIYLLSCGRRTCTAVAQDVATRLRQTLHRQTLRLGPGDLDESSGLRPVQLFTEDVDRVRHGVYLWTSRIGRYLFKILLLVLLALAVHWRVALQCLIPLALCWYLLHREQRRSRDAQALARARADSELRLLAESLRKTRLVRGYGMETFEHERFRTHLERFHQNVLSAFERRSWSLWAGRLIVLVSAAVVLFLVGVKVLDSPEGPQGLSFPAAVLLLSAFACLYLPLEALARLPGELDEAAAASDRIHRYLDQIPEVGQAVGARFLQPLSRTLQFESVTYRLPGGRALLAGFDLRLEAGQSYALVSFDPLEARAAAYLLPRFIEPQSGRVLFDGEDIAWVTLESLRAEAVYVGGADPFFTGTVRENISCGNDGYSLPDVTDAAKQVHANKFILNLPQGYETVVGEHGEPLEAGQSFRLGLARAILRKPALLIVEEPTEPLDDDTKSLLDDAYNRVVHDRTVLFLPARLSTVRRTDQIVFVHRGKVEAVGSHADLVRTSALYRHWEYLRFNEFRHLVAQVG
ncbi:MAG TPA: ABC transporter ATP-binding protein [Planctomycetaceae bacterium]|nr:ABC transporter ATP-binding protein [Planctomycetaceae bacterium]